VEDMSDNERQQLEDHLQTAEEVAMTLVYCDGSSQLTEILDNVLSNIYKQPPGWHPKLNNLKCL